MTLDFVKSAMDPTKAIVKGKFSKIMIISMNADMQMD